MQSTIKEEPKNLKYYLKLPSKWARKLYNWTLKWGESKYADYALFGIAFAESSFFPIPPDVLLLALVVAKPKNYVRLALITTIGSVLGSILGYTIGYTLFETIGQPIVDIYHLQEEIAQVGSFYEENAVYAILVSSITPIPYKVFTIAAGLFKISLPLLLVSSFVGRGIRFFTVAFLVQRFGERIKHLIEKYFDLFGILLVVIILLGILAIRYI